MWWTGLVEAISKPFTQWFKNKGDIKKAKHKLELAIIDNQSRLALSEAEYNHQWEMESLKGNSPHLRVFCFVQFAIPLTVSVVSPEHGATIWANLELVPKWFVQVYMLMVGAIWGISEIKRLVPTMLGEIGARIKSKKKD